MAEPLILLDPWPRTLDLLCDGPMRARLEALGRLVVHEGGRMPAETVDAHLPEAAAIVGQTTMDASRIARAPRLRAIVNVEGNFLANVDYEACHARGIHALVASPAFAPAVAEAALGMAIDLARGITAADRAMRTGTEVYDLAGNRDSFLLAGADVGVIGLGDLARELLPDGAALLLMSRAAVADIDAIVDLAAAGRLRAAIDVWPQEPVAADHPARAVEGLLLSPHRAGGIPEAFREIGRLVVADLELVLRGLPPVACRRAERETVGRLRSRPIDRAS